MDSEYYKKSESVEEYIKMAKDVSGKELIEKLKNYLLLGSSFLEIGSGLGTDWRILIEEYKTTGSDYSQEFLKRLVVNNPKGNFIELDAITLKIDSLFDGIYSNKVMHHLNDKELHASIKRQCEILNPNGIICHSFWNGTGTEIYNDLFVNYQNEESLKNFFEQNFDVLYMELYKEFEEEDSLLFIGKKK